LMLSIAPMTALKIERACSSWYELCFKSDATISTTLRLNFSARRASKIRHELKRQKNTGAARELATPVSEPPSAAVAPEEQRPDSVR
jgi:hypothetical protein